MPAFVGKTFADGQRLNAAGQLNGLFRQALVDLFVIEVVSGNQLGGVGMRDSFRLRQRHGTGDTGRFPKAAVTLLFHLMMDLHRIER